MGDILHALPAVTALRLAHPTWQIGWVVDPRWQALLKARNEGTREQGNKKQGAEISAVRGSAMPVVDRLHFASTRAANYDAAVDLQGAIRSAVIVRLSGCPRRIGEATPREWPAQWLFTERVRTRGAHVIEQDVELAAAVAGDVLIPAEPLLPVDPEAESWCDTWLAASFGGKPWPIALLAPGAGWGAKRWPPERYAVVAERLKQRGFHVLANSGPGEEQLAATIVAGGAAVPLTTTMPQLIALTRRIALCIAGDTGPLHLACALGRPVVGIYGPTDPSRNGPYGTRAKVLRRPGSRRDHSRRTAPDPGLLTIAPEDVLRAADELLAEGQAR
jgi:heptosyltransferase-1